METSKRFLHDRLVLLLLLVLAVLTVVGISLVVIRFDATRNPTTTVAYRPNIVGSQYESGKPIDIYSLAVFMLFVSLSSIFLGRQTYKLRRPVSVFILSSAIFLLLLSIIVSNALISLQ